MSSESHRTTTRTISIAMIMLISALAPMAVPVSATHGASDPLVLEMQDDNGNWTNVPEFVDPITGNGDFLEPGTYEFRFTSNDLTLNDSYELDWDVEVCEFFSDECDETVSESRSWNAMGASSTESWNLTLGIMDCDVSVYAYFSNATSGDSFEYSWDILGPCGNTGDITLELDLDDDGVDEVVQGFDFDEELSLSAGDYVASFNVSNLSSTGSYNMTWFVDLGEDYDEFVDGEAAWTGTDPGNALDFDLEIQITTCDFMILAVLGDVSAGEDISAFVAMARGPCVQPIAVSIYHEESGEWIEMGGTMPEADYPDCFWSDEEVLWWCGEDTDGDGTLDYTDTWWYYCELSDYGWLCTDYFGQSEDHEFTENNTLLQPIFLEEGTYDVLVNLSALNATTHYAVHLGHLNPEYMEFNSTTENYSISAELPVSITDCDEWFEISVYDDPSNYPYEMPTFFTGLSYIGPCEQPPSRFNLTYDGMDYEMEYEYGTYDDCTDVGDGWECEVAHDWDNDGEADDYHYDYFPYDDCEFSEDEMLWYCEMYGMGPILEEGNHSMELVALDLVVGDNYSVHVMIDVGTQQMHHDDEWIYDFEATAEEEAIDFYVETNNLTCYVDIRAVLSEDDGNHTHDVGMSYFSFGGPCEQPPSPFTLTYDGMDYEMDYHYSTYDDCTDVGDGWECEVAHDWDNDGEADDYHYDYFPYDDCEFSEDEMLWYCVTGEMHPAIEEGNHTMELTVEDLEVGTNYSLEISTSVCENMAGCEYDWMTFEFSATAETMTETFHMVTDNYTCGVSINVYLYEQHEDGSGYWVASGNFQFNGPCEEPPPPFTLTYDGVEWEEDWHYEAFDECEDIGDGWECEVAHDWDNDGEADDYHYDYFPYDDCEELSDGYWECAVGWSNPFIDAGNHTMELTVENLEVGTNYSLEISTNLCENMAGCEYDWMTFEFSATAETMTETFHMVTDNYTCGVNINVHLYVDMGNWNSHVANDYFHFNGPCEQPPSPFTLTYDGMDYEMDYHYSTYDDCTDVGDGWECEVAHDWDNDGEADDYHYDYFPYDDCEFSEDEMLWYCVTGEMHPAIEEGNHTMELTVEDLEVGTNYTVEMYIDICQNMAGCDGDWGGLDFTATAETMSETFHIVTDNYTCDVYINVELYEEGDWGHSRVAYDYFLFRGPCEQPPSPFTLTYDGMDYEMDYHYSTYDDCTDVGDGWECEVAHDWDNDGEADDYHYDYFPYDDCEFSEDEMLWYCVTGEMHPAIEEGNHTMELTVEDLEVGTNYSLEISTSVCENMAGCEYDWMTFEFSATAETMTETFHMVTDNYTCGVSINVYLYEDGDWGHSRVANDYFHFRGPCEQPPSPFTLTYDGIEYEMGSETVAYLDCTDDGWSWECMDDNNGDYWHYQYEDCEFSEDDMVWYCVNMVDPYLNAGNHTMEITVEGLEPGMNYSMQINSFMWGMFSGSDDMTIQLDFTADSDVMSEEFVIEVMNSTCNVNINVQLYEDSDWGNSHVAHDYFNFEAPCEMEMDFPVDLGLEVDDGGWATIDSMPMDLFFSDEDEMSDAEMLEMMLENVGYVMEEGNWSLRWTMDGLTNGSEYMLEVEMETPSMEEDGETTFFCGNGDEIPFYWVNDEIEDCEDGSDEQQYDEDGDPINWFDCMDGSEVWIYQVNDGNFDCPDGEDEYSESSGNGEEEYFYYHTATGDHGHVEWNMEVTEDTCFMMINAALSDMNEGSLVSMFIAMVMGPMATIDDNGNEIPDCIEMMINDGSDGDGPDWDMEDFAVGRDYEAVLEQVDFNESHVVLFVAQHTIMHDDFRMKIDHDFFNGDDYLNETEAMEFEDMWVMNALPEGCDESAPAFAVSGFEVDCAQPMQMFHGLANDSEEEGIVWTAGWLLHYSNVTVDDNGELVIYYAGEDEDGEPEEFNGSICGSAGEFSGLLPVSWSYNGSAVESDCVMFEAGDRIASIEIIFGLPDSDGDGYNDLDDRFPDDPEEWADTDDDGYGDNHDMFPDDPTEHWDSDGDGYGDNGDQYPWDASEWADSDGDGYGDNSDAFPNDSTEWADTDADGTGDNADTDADGDGIDDSDEDSDGDGVNDDQDDFPFDANETMDSDGDGVGDNSDDFPDDANETSDTDGDGIGDNSDDDVDGDGVTNDLDDFPLDSGQSSDADGDGVGDAEDAFPNNANEYADSDGDGVGDNADDDDDNDGTPDTSDAFPTNPNEDTDTDGDGYGDNSDAFPNDAGEWNDYDGDGVGDNSDAFMTDPYESRDTDGDGLGDNADAFPNDPNEKIDSDGDGVGNNADAFPTDPSETTDTDGDGVGDNADDDADGDGVPDEPVTPVDGGDSGGILPGFTALTGLASVLGAAILVAGRRKD